MKKVFIFCSLVFMVSLGYSQAKTQEKTPTPSNSRNGSKMVGPNAIEVSLAQGELIFTKVFHQTNQGNQTIGYTIWKSTDPKFYNANPIAIELNTSSFELVFNNPAVNVKDTKQKLLKLIQEQKLNLSEEKAWIKLVKHYNLLN